MQKQGAEPEPIPSPSLSSQDCSFPSFHNLSLEEKNFPVLQANEEFHSFMLTEHKTKGIQKDNANKKHYAKEKQSKTKESSKKKMEKLERVISDLQAENDRLKRKIECCVHCSKSMTDQNQYQSTGRPNFEEQMRKIAGSLDEPRHNRDSHGSLEFQNVEFHAPYMDKEIDDKAWVFLGTVMIAMGSKCLEVDGTINVFKVLKQTVDSLRRQVQKSEPNISMDFYISKQEMNCSAYMQEIGFDPFTTKNSEFGGLCLQGVKIQSVQQFQLTYDSKLTYNLKYEALLGAMEYIREHSWILG